MRFRFDQLAKQLATAFLEGCGETNTDQEVLTDSQHIDIVHVPAPDASERRARLGLLGRMTASTCLVEPFHDPPDEEAVRDCTRKHLSFHRVRINAAQAALSAKSMVLLAPCWILSSGRPAAVLTKFGFSPILDWPAGSYEAPPGFGLRMVVLTELPRTRDTLLVRLFGRGRVLRDALQDLVALPEGTWEREVALPPIKLLRFEIPEDPHKRTAEEEEFVVTAQELMEAFETKAMQKGRAEGWLAPLAHQFERRLGRRLREDERALLQERTQALGPDRVGDVVLDLSADALAAWLADPDAR